MRGFEGERSRDPRADIGLDGAWEGHDAEETRRLLDRAVAASINGIVISDPSLPDNPIIYANPAFERMTGYSRGEVVGRNCRFLQNDDRDQTEIDHLKEAVSEGREFRAVIRNYKKSGEMFWNELYVSPVYGDQNNEGRPTNFIGVQHDITERREAEESLNEQEAQWRTLVESNPSFVALIDVDGRANYYNSGWLDYLGVEKEEIIHHKWPRSIHPEERDELYATLSASYLRGESFSIPSMRIQNRDGEYHWFTAIISPVKNEAGNISSWITVSTDIEELRKFQQTMLENEERLRLAFRATSLGAWDYSPVTSELDCDERTKEMFGCPPESDDVTFDAFIGRLHPDEVERMKEAIERAFDPEGDGEFAESFRVICGDGITRWLYSTGRALFDEVEGVRSAYRFIGTILDITERKQADEWRDLLLARERAARSEAVAARRRLDFLVEADAVLLSSTGYRHRLRDTAKLAVPGLADWCIVDVLNDDGSVAQVAASHADPEKQELLEELERRRNLSAGSSGISMSVFESGEPRLIGDARGFSPVEDPESEERNEIVRELGVASLMSVPLLARGRTLGVMTLVSSDPGRLYDEEDLSFAESLAYRCALAVDNARLYRERGHIARTLQKSLLPTIPKIENVEVGVVYLSAGEQSLIGGDFYDLIQTDSGKLMAVVGDVCGKGPAAAAVTALARYTIQAIVMEKDSPANALNSLNRAMLRQTEDVKFCTVACGRLEEVGEDGAFDFVVARGGHPAPVLIRSSGEVEKINPQGRVIGVFDDPGLKEETVRMNPGDSVVLYTDGIIEAKDAEGNLFGEEHLLEALTGLNKLPAGEIAQELRNVASEFSDGSPKDDIAVLVIKVPEPAD